MVSRRRVDHGLAQQRPARTDGEPCRLSRGDRELCSGSGSSEQVGGGLVHIGSDASNAQMDQLETGRGDALMSVVRALHEHLALVPFRALDLSPQTETRQPHIGAAQQPSVQPELGIDVEGQPAADQRVYKLGFGRTRATALGVGDGTTRRALR